MARGVWRGIKARLSKVRGSSWRLCGVLVSLIDTWLSIKLRVGAGVFIVLINEQALPGLFFLDLVCLITAPVADGVSQALNPTLHMNDCRDPPNFNIYQAGYDGQICIEHIHSKILGRLDDVSWAGDYFHPCMIRIPQIYPMWQSEHQFRQKWGFRCSVQVSPCHSYQAQVGLYAICFMRLMTLMLPTCNSVHILRRP